MDQMKTEGSVHPTPKTVQKNVGLQKIVGFNPTPKTMQKNVGFKQMSIGVGFNPTPKTVQKNHTLNEGASLLKKGRSTYCR